jgi:hypothetical protein
MTSYHTRVAIRRHSVVMHFEFRPGVHEACASPHCKCGMYSGGISEPKTRQLVDGADLVLDLGGVNLNDITTSAYSDPLDLSRFITVGLDDVRMGDEVIANVRLTDVLAELAKRKPSSAPYKGDPQGLAPVSGNPSDKVTMAALYPRYAAFLHAGDTVVLETGSSSLGVTPTILPDGVRVEAQVLWGSIGWATPAAFGANWFTARVTTLGELDDAMKSARANKSGAYIEIMGGKMDMPPALAFAHGQLKAMYGDTP